MLSLRGRLAAAGLLIGLATSVALAQTQQSQGPAATTTPARPSATVPDVTVTAQKHREDVPNARLLHDIPCTAQRPADAPRTTPQVVDSYPKSGDTVPAGLIFLRVTYSEPMSRCGFLLWPDTSLYGPKLLDVNARLTPDLKTFFFAARLRPGKRYAIWFNSTQDLPHFVSLYGMGAEPHEIVFSTSKTQESGTVNAALAADPGIRPILQMPGRVIELWVPRIGGSLPMCGNCSEHGATMAEHSAFANSLNTSTGSPNVDVVGGGAAFDPSRLKAY